MQLFIRILSAFIFGFSLVWLVTTPGLQPLFSCVIATTMFATTFLSSKAKLVSFLSGFTLIGTSIWAIVEFPSLEPTVALGAAIMGYTNSMIEQNNHDNRNQQSDRKDNVAMRNALKMAKRSLEILEEQAAGYTKLTIPSHLRIELEEKREEVTRLSQKLDKEGEIVQS